MVRAVRGIDGDVVVARDGRACGRAGLRARACAQSCRPDLFCFVFLCKFYQLNE